MTAQVAILCPPGRTCASRCVCADDVCGRRVIDTDGRDLGEVDDLIVVAERKSWLLWVTAGDLAESEPTSFLIPSDVVTRVTTGAVYIDRCAAEVATAPQYDPGVPEEVYLHNLLRYYTGAGAYAVDRGDRP